MNLTTGPGQYNKKSTPKTPVQLIDAINQIFTLFRLNYHNQYHKAFGDVEELSHVKRLWVEVLGRFRTEAILIAAKKLIENNEFLPTLHEVIRQCEQASDETRFPDAHSAYIEACRAPSPKAGNTWSHLAVYYAGQASDWYFLQTNPENVAFPIFKSKYNEICDRIRDGETLAEPQAPALEQIATPALDKKTNLEKLNELKSVLELD